MTDIVNFGRIVITLKCFIILLSLFSEHLNMLLLICRYTLCLRLMKDMITYCAYLLKTLICLNICKCVFREEEWFV